MTELFQESNVSLAFLAFKNNFKKDFKTEGQNDFVSASLFLISDEM